MFAGNDEVHLEGALLRQAPALITNVGLVWKVSPGTKNQRTKKNIYSIDVIKMSLKLHLGNNKLHCLSLASFSGNY
jgi:hypothetical protein